jgi:hypothetical protein
VRLHQLFAEIEKRLRKIRVRLRRHAKLGDGNVKSPLFVRIYSRLHVPRAFGGNILQAQQKK